MYKTVYLNLEASIDGERKYLKIKKKLNFLDIIFSIKRKSTPSFHNLNPVTEYPGRFFAGPYAGGGAKGAIAPPQLEPRSKFWLEKGVF